jgi:hypothetical protein
MRCAGPRAIRHAECHGGGAGEAGGPRRRIFFPVIARPFLVMTILREEGYAETWRIQKEAGEPAGRVRS